jgi:hypothetical protein
VFFAFILIAIILVIAYAFLKYRKYMKILSAAILITIVVIAGIWAVWSSEADIGYWFVAPYTTAAQDNSLDIYCENKGQLTGTFNLIKDSPGGVTSTSYQKDPATQNFTMRLQAPPP